MPRTWLAQGARGDAGRPYAAEFRAGEPGEKGPTCLASM
jgi:hypothetical protein